MPYVMPIDLAISELEREMKSAVTEMAEVVQSVATSPTLEPHMVRRVLNRHMTLGKDYSRYLALKRARGILHELSHTQVDVPYYGNADRKRILEDMPVSDEHKPTKKAILG